MAFFLFLAFAYLAHSQGLTAIIFPPNVAFCNSDFNETVTINGSPVLAGTGHLDFDRTSGSMHALISAQGQSVEEWIIQKSTGDAVAYILINGQCSKNDVPTGSISCKGWEENKEKQVWTEDCTLPGGAGAMTLLAATVGTQVASITQTVTISGQPPQAVVITFLTTSANPPAPGSFTPPSNCPSSNKVESHLAKRFIH